ncbi:MAG TPA: hypothetical protein VJ828_05470 [Lacipirellulaceae bacterium]|nr:hypothetical protein [Lacipirellulaceae bacterium]
MSKKKRRGFVRTTISLPAELRRRMKACGDEVNWSAVAARAFAAEVARIKTQKDDVRIEDVVARLRGTQGRSRSELFHQGRLQGEKWATRQATAAQLHRLWAARRDANRQTGTNAENWLSAVDNKRPPVDVVMQLVGQPKAFNPACGEMMKSSEFVHGFAAGAIHIWKQVAKKLRHDFE